MVGKEEGEQRRGCDVEGVERERERRGEEASDGV
jgi:hypothetical protein